MVGYLVAWLVYLAAAFGLLWVYKKGFAHYFPQSVQPILLVLFACIMLTPWPIESNSWVPALRLWRRCFTTVGFWRDSIKKFISHFSGFDHCLFCGMVHDSKTTNLM